MRLGELTALWGPPIGVERLDPEMPLGPVCTDSRALATGQLFVALVGERFDGHDFLEQALELGAQAALVDRSHSARLPPGLPAWVVDDTLLGYQHLARQWRRSLAAPVVAVTGSAGKTTTRELLRAALEPLGPVLASSGNDNNDVGVPATLLRATPQHRAIVVEMGMRGSGEIERLSRCAEPDVVVITNIGTAHIGRLGSREAISRAKCEITSSLRPDGLVVIPAGDPLLEHSLRAVWTGRVLRVALATDPVAADLPPADWCAQLQGGDLVCNGDHFRLPLDGAHNARNLLLALAVADQLGVPAAELAALRPRLPGGRSSRRQLGAITLLDETYNASPEAVAAALHLLAAQPGRHLAVLGTMRELGDHSVELHRSIGALASELGLDGLVIVDGGAEGEAMAEAALKVARLARVATPEQALSPLLEWLRPDDQLLLKASRGVALERLIPALEARFG
ncbi:MULTISPECIES: UDP-N-acetylmuramoyl-tripeptide--D-alanyl-D-alanine ligase [unclassified Synechococcus]|uniref:UDP-N-acetylmuramoyl-tripeptide--D-alanyl-D- alanine ligase n=1 Tax=unclassified Synechococcus TaxID=2626047 RepID=UPI0021A6E501|nr:MULTISPECIES: UDP-N-acetylmuramoyl-tripeptide--D-alanyl-D-alanine ligase [unclassified Synechococcus]MCT0212120.1 UDP-N-acetylmuramoyl-tripeptide--D-alanyl-D-alanine ligase [Synechococcus sp. CS-1326]MCT0232908.1 UDP-N-acetylmuramoyl-tripeptide--D-alanyl-D-alanine ligase [Synechococcus sp. CS-1327]